MKKTVLVLILGIVLLAVFGPEAKAQVPREGTTSFTCYFSGTFKLLSNGGDRVQVNYEFMGVIIGDTPEDFFHNSSNHCLGAEYTAKNQIIDDSGFCVMTRPDGDQIFWTYKDTGTVGAYTKGTFTIVGGTGKLVGIQGSTEYTAYNVRPAAEGTIQGCVKNKGQYKLP